MRTTRAALALALSLALIPTVALTQAQTGPSPKLSIVTQFCGVFAGGATKCRTFADWFATEVYPENYALAGDLSDDLAVQRAADTGKTVRFQSGKTYRFCRAALGKKFIGDGTPVIQAHPESVCKYNPGPDGDGRDNTNNIERFRFFSNPNWKANVKTDSHIHISGLIFDGYNIPGVNGSPHGGFHAVGIRMATDVVVRDITCRGVGDCTAFQGTERTLVDSSRAFDVTNVGFDHWEGPVDATVQNSIVTCLAVPGGGAGIMFTASATNHAPGAVGRNLTSRGNRVSGICNIGITANILSPASYLINVVSEGDTVNLNNLGSVPSVHGGGLMAPAPAGIIFTGDVRGGRISDASIYQCNGGQAITLSPDTAEATTGGGTGTPSSITISDAQIINCNTSSGNVAPLTALGQGHRLVNPRIAGGTFDYAVWTNTNSVVLQGGLLQPGALGMMLNQNGPIDANFHTANGPLFQSRDRITLSPQPGNVVVINNLPTVPPTVPGALWNDLGTLKVAP